MHRDETNHGRQLSDYAVGMLWYGLIESVITQTDVCDFRMHFQSNLRFRAPRQHHGAAFLGPDSLVVTIRGEPMNGGDATLGVSPLGGQAILDHPGYPQWISSLLFRGGERYNSLYHAGVMAGTVLGPRRRALASAAAPASPAAAPASTVASPAAAASAPAVALAPAPADFSAAAAAAAADLSGSAVSSPALPFFTPGTSPLVPAGPAAALLAAPAAVPVAAAAIRSRTPSPDLPAAASGSPAALPAASAARTRTRTPSPELPATAPGSPAAAQVEDPRVASAIAVHSARRVSRRLAAATAAAADADAPASPAVD
ncbi:uncharacterized protein BP5553_07612 [Venustampulla echinocandica]|uniref:Uncharacterized protein n=1 Tax=Venustampulla echinocandica TaxID=2656787 RepID=A0A370TH05_9HELO|nr:uncharacterized protein BP5553_07612 [Venustampulla echinocandica]RDL34484.1 hypothetical protein BP5553_07612 [Venustampulla echinocandica]